MIRGNKYSLNTVLLQEFFIFRGRKGWTVVADNLSWEPVSCEDAAQGVGCAFCSGSFHRTNYFRPFRMCINHDEIMVGLMSSKINVYAVPWSGGP